MTRIPLDLHLMITRPDNKLDWFQIQPGEYVSVHWESTPHIPRVLARIRELGGKPMLALNPQRRCLFWIMYWRTLMVSFS